MFLDKMLQFLQRSCFCLQAAPFQWQLTYPWMISYLGWIPPSITATVAPWPPPVAMRLLFGLCSRTRSKSAKMWWVLGNSTQMLEQCFVYLTGLIFCLQIDKFSQIVYVTNSTSPLIVNNYRNIQPALSVTTSSTAKTCYSLGLMALTILLGRF